MRWRLSERVGVAAAFALGDPFGDVVLGGRIVLATMQDDGVERAVQLSVAATAEPMPGRLAAGGGDRRDAGEAGEGGFGADASPMRPGDDRLRGDDRADAGFVEQLWREGAHVYEDLAFELVGLGGRRLNPSCEAAQDEPCRELVGGLSDSLCRQGLT